MAVVAHTRQIAGKPIAGAKLNLSHWQSRGLVGQWMFDGNSQGCPNLVTPGTLDCTYTGTPLGYHTHRRGGGLGIATNGTSSRAAIADAAALQATTFSVVVWLDASRVTGAVQQYVLKASGTDPNIRGWSIYWDADNRLKFRYGNGSSWPRTALQSGTTLPGGLICVVGVRGASTSYLYANGELISSAANGLFAVSTTTPIDFGFNTTYSTYYKTNVTQFRYYSTELTAAEVAGINADPFGNLDQSSNRRTFYFDATNPAATAAQNLLLLGVG